MSSPDPHRELSQCVLSVASQQGSSSVSDAWVLDGTHTAHRGPAVICLLKRLQMPLAVCHPAQSSLQTQRTAPPCRGFTVSEQTACVDGPAQGTICTVGGQKKSGYEFQPEG